MSFTTRLICCAAVLAALLTPGMPALAQDPVVVRVAPATLTLAVGGESDVAVEVVEVEGLYGFDVRLSFDPAVVEVVDADPDQAGVQVSLGRMLDSGMAVRDSADNEAGTIHYAMTQINPSEAKSGTGNLIVIRLRGKAAGATDLTITSLDLAARDATAIPASSQPGNVMVQSGASSQPTTTPIPTQAPPTPIPSALPEVGQGAQAQPAATATPAAVAATPTQPAPTQPPPATPTALAQQVPTEPPATSGQTQAAAQAPTAVDTALAASPPAGGDGAQPAAAAAEAVVTPEPAEQQPAPAVADPTGTPQAIAAAPDAGGDGAANTTGVRQSEAQTSRSPEQALLSVGVIALLMAAALGLVLGVMALRRRRTGDQ